jgi:hypothetical protein
MLGSPARRMLGRALAAFRPVGAVMLIGLLATLSGCLVGSDSVQSLPTTQQLVSISLSPADASLAAGSTQQLTATGIYSDGSKQNVSSSASWTSSQPAIATVSASGTATGLSTGSSTVTAAAGGISGVTTLTVTAAHLVSIGVTPAAPSIALGTTQTLKATGVYSDNSIHDVTDTASWESATPAVAAVSSAGQATGSGVGETSITAMLGGVTSPAVTLKVTGATLVSIGVTPGAPSNALGTGEQFTATGTYTDNSTQDLTSAATWVSSSASVASISNAAGSNGLATALVVGSTTITAVSGSITSNPVTLTVPAATLVSIAITPAAPSIALSTQQQFTATGTYTDNSTQDLTSAATWVSSTTSVASISNAAGSNGLATALVVGSTTITAVSGSITSNPVTLTVPAATLVSIAITPVAPSIASGLPQQFAATGTYTDNSTQDLTTQVAWMSGNVGVATISNAPGTQGLASSATAGTAPITATLGTVASAPITLTVTSATLVSIGISHPPAVLNLGDLAEFNAFGGYTDGSFQLVTTLVTWASSDTTVMTISNAAGSNGMGTLLAPGMTIISVTLDGLTAFTSLTVDP